MYTRRILLKAAVAEPSVAVSVHLPTESAIQQLCVIRILSIRQSNFMALTQPNREVHPLSGRHGTLWK